LRRSHTRCNCGHGHACEKQVEAHRAAHHSSICRTPRHRQRAGLHVDAARKRRTHYKAVSGATQRCNVHTCQKGAVLITAHNHNVGGAALQRARAICERVRPARAAPTTGEARTHHAHHHARGGTHNRNRHRTRQQRAPKAHPGNKGGGQAIPHRISTRRSDANACHGWGDHGD
jgi:hypothetical protein